MRTKRQARTRGDDGIFITGGISARRLSTNENEQNNRGRRTQLDDDVIDLTNDDSLLSAPRADGNGRKRTRRNNTPGPRAGDDSVVVIGGTTDDVVVVGELGSKPKKKTKIADNDGSADTSGGSVLCLHCPVCFDSFEDIKVEGSRRICATDCGHLFCSTCIDDAITVHHACPTCRQPLTKTEVRPIYM